ncbi:MAG: cytochrome P450 [Thermoproteota archaeon]|nr:cytochrome P450 [Thermoproteota archaeon]
MNSKIIKYPPGPTPKIPGKLIRQFIRDPIKTLSTISQTYGDISYFKLGPKQHVYLINNPDYIEKILIYDHRNFKKGKRLQIAKSLLGEGLVTSEGDFHNRQRRLIQPIFHPKQIIEYEKIMTDYALRFRDRWKNDDTIDVSQEMMELTLGIICKSVLNYDVETEAKQVGKALTTTRNYSRRLQSPLGHILDKIPILPAPKGARKAKEELDSLVYGLISERRAQQQVSDNNKRYDDLLSKLLAVQDSNLVGPASPGGTQSSPSYNDKMSDKQARDEVMTIFIAGHETTANALTWTFYLLSQHPDVEEKLHNEIDSTLGTADGKGRVDGKKVPTADDVPKLQYTEKVLRESMRLYPPVWTLGRYVETDYQVGEYTIPAGSSILMSQYVIHHDPRYYEAPEQFNPDRWTAKFKTDLPRFSYFPFGGGIRGCIGEPFAWIEGILIIATIAQKWAMHLVPGQRIKLDPEITLRPKYGMKMKLVQRKD